MAQEHYSAKEFADIAKVSATTITNWMNAGMPAIRSGKQKDLVRINLKEIIPWLVTRKSSESSERERLASEQADKLALQNAVKRGELIYADQFSEILMAMAADLNGRHDALPGRLAGELAGITDHGHIRTLLREELRAVRASFADAVARLGDSLGTAEDDSSDIDAASESGAESVGG